MECTKRVATVLAVITFSSPMLVLAHGASDHASAGTRQPVKAEQTAFGIAGNAGKASRTIDLDALDSFRYSPGRITVKLGETIRFVMHNKGEMQHEIVIGTLKELQEHAALMKKFPEMEHEAPNMLHVAPGRSGDIVWRFNRAGTFSFACLVAGHFEAGMVGTIVVT